MGCDYLGGRMPGTGIHCLPRLWLFDRHSGDSEDEFCNKQRRIDITENDLFILTIGYYIQNILDKSMWFKLTTRIKWYLFEPIQFEPRRQILVYFKLYLLFIILPNQSILYSSEVLTLTLSKCIVMYCYYCVMCKPMINFEAKLILSPWLVFIRLIFYTGPPPQMMFYIFLRRLKTEY